jgi:hypothetical protein
MSAPLPQDDREGHVNKEAAMTTTLFVSPEMVHAEVDARRERLAHDWQQHARPARRAHRLRLGVRLPVRARRHA